MVGTDLKGKANYNRRYVKGREGRGESRGMVVPRDTTPFGESLSVDHEFEKGR